MYKINPILLFPTCAKFKKFAERIARHPSLPVPDPTSSLFSHPAYGVYRLELT